MNAGFSGFPRDTFAFFRQLGRNNAKAWFDRNRQRYEQSVVQPFRGLLAALTPFVLKLDGGFEVGGKTNRNFSRINRDIRFRPDRAPYHTNYYLYFFDHRLNRMDAGRLYVGLSAEGATVGFSIYGDRGSLLDRVTKERVASDSSLLEKHLARLGRRYESYWYRIEKGEWKKRAGHPRLADDWQRVKGWVVRKTFPVSRAAAAGFLQQIKGTFAELYPLYVFTSGAGEGWKRNLIQGQPRRWKPRKSLRVGKK